jgi:hypothetical protein
MALQSLLFYYPTCSNCIILFYINEETKKRGNQSKWLCVCGDDIICSDKDSGCNGHSRFIGWLEKEKASCVVGDQAGPGEVCYLRGNLVYLSAGSSRNFSESSPPSDLSEEILW